MKKVTTGTGITEQERMVTETDDEVREALRALAARNGESEFERVTRIARNTAERIERKAGKGIAPSDSPHDFAIRILTGIAAADGGIRDGNADAAARFAFVAGVEWATAVFKWQWEADALSGQKQRKAGARGNQMRTDTSFEAVHGEAAQLMANALAKRYPNWSWTAIRVELRKHFRHGEGKKVGKMYSDKTIKEALTNPKKVG